MFGTKKHRRDANERLDRLGREIVRAAAKNEAEAESAAASPFLYTRVRARIAAEQKRRQARENWLSLLTVARRAVPAMSLSAAVAVGVFMFGRTAQIEQSFDDELLFAANESGVARVVFDDADTLSNDDMLDTIMSGGEPEASR